MVEDNEVSANMFATFKLTQEEGIHSWYQLHPVRNLLETRRK